VNKTMFRWLAGMTTLILGASSITFAVEERPRRQVLCEDDMSRALGGDPVCLGEGAAISPCPATGCPNLSPCAFMQGSTTECREVLRNAYAVCGEPGSSPNHNCTAVSTPNLCGLIKYSTVAPMASCPGGCATNPTQCGAQTWTVTVAACPN